MSCDLTRNSSLTYVQVLRGQTLKLLLIFLEEVSHVMYAFLCLLFGCHYLLWYSSQHPRTNPVIRLRSSRPSVAPTADCTTLLAVVTPMLLHKQVVPGRHWRFHPVGRRNQCQFSREYSHYLSSTDFTTNLLPIVDIRRCHFAAQ